MPMTLLSRGASKPHESHPLLETLCRRAEVPDGPQSSTFGYFHSAFASWIGKQYHAV
jgi:hypothetical protein